jgi:glutaconate CoA-transferase subunit B
LAREICDGDTFVVGAGSLLPAAAFLLARRMWAPNAWLLTTAGAFCHLSAGPLSLEDFDVRLARRAGAWVPMSSIAADLSRFLARNSVEFLRPAQLDQHGRVNNSWLRGSSGQVVQLPGAAGMATVVARRQRVLCYEVQHDAHVLRPAVDAVSGDAFAAGRTCPLVVHTPLATLGAGPRGDVQVLYRAPDVSPEELAAATPFRLIRLEQAPERPQPSPDELSLLRYKIDPDGMRYLEAARRGERLALLGKRAQR